MKVCIVSTYPPIECGIATYTSYLTSELKKYVDNIYIISEYSAKGENVFGIYDSNEPDLAHKIFQVINKIHPEVVHIQHEFGLYGMHKGVNVIPLIYKLKLAKTPVVVTMHTIYDHFTYDNKIITEAIIRASDAIIVHENYQKESILKNIAQFNHIFTIPHGVRKVSFIKNAKEIIEKELLKKESLKDKKAILLMGFFRPSKNFEQIIKLFPKIKKKVKNCVLIVAGDARIGENLEYLSYLEELIKASEAKDSIIYIKGHFDQKRYDQIVCCADVAVLPYKITAQSGVMAHFLAYSIPLVTSDLRVFNDLLNKVKIGFTCKNDDEYISSIVKVLTDNNLLIELKNNIQNYVAKNLLWEIIAKNTVEIYKKYI